MNRGSLFFDQLNYRKMKARETRSRAYTIVLIITLCTCTVLGGLAYAVLPAIFSDTLTKTVVTNDVDSCKRVFEAVANDYSRYVDLVSQTLSISSQTELIGQDVIGDRIEYDRLEAERVAKEERLKDEEERKRLNREELARTNAVNVATSPKPASSQSKVAMGGDNKPASIDNIQNYKPVTPENLDPNGNYGIPEYWPIQGCRVSSKYGYLPERGRFHAGVDLVADKGTPICAAGAGKVIRVDKIFGGYGMCVDIQHSSGYITRYGHLSGFYVKIGDFVNAGDWIGACGSTGRSTCPHLHFEVHKDGSSINPESSSLNWAGKP